MSFDSTYLDSFNAAKKDLVLTAAHPDSETLIIVAEGIMDTYNSPDANKALLQTITSETGKNIVLDLEQLTYVSSTGVGTLVEVLKASTNLDKNLFLMNMDKKVKEVMELLGFLGMFSVVSTVDEIKESSKSSAFPATVRCPHCDTKLKIPKSGRFKCSNCKKVVELDKDGKLAK
jgi:anti-sigma B factor antagonist